MPLAQILQSTADGLPLKSKCALAWLLAAAFAVSATLLVRPAGADDIFTTSTGVSNANLGAYSTSGQTINASLVALETGAWSTIAAYGNDLFVQYHSDDYSLNGISEYTTSGQLVNFSLISFDIGVGLAGVFNGDLLLGSASGLAEYTTSGTLINPSFITPPSGDSGIGNLNFYGGDIFATVGTGYPSANAAEYNSAGQLINGSLITDVSGGGTDGFAVAGGNIFVGDGSSVLVYTLSGTLVTSFPLDGVLQGISPIVASGNDLFFMMNFTVGGYGIAEYTDSGTLVNGQLVDGLGIPYGFAILATPEPSSLVLMALGAIPLIALRRRKR